jgi:superfamily II DNA/RNA helicase
VVSASVIILVQNKHVVAFHHRPAPSSNLRPAHPILLATSRASRIHALGMSYETFGDGALSEETFGELYGRTICDPPDHGDEDQINNLPKWLTDRCAECGWPTPTLVQRRSLDAILTGKDVVIQAQTGSGKTLSFLLPLLAKINASRSSVQGMIVVPTRELGLQVSRVARRLAAASSVDNEAGGKIMVMPVLQGSANRRQRAWAWAEPPHVVIGTPDELTKMVSKGGIRYNNVKYVVVDEVDACLLNNGGTYGGGSLSNLSSAGPLHDLLSRYLSPTFDEADVLEEDGSSLISSSASDIAKAQRTVSHGTDRQTVFASATIPQHNHFMKQCVQNQWTVREPMHVCASPGELVPPTLKHAMAVCKDMKNKFPGLKRMIKKELSKGSLKKALVFCQPQRPMEEMAAALAADLGGRVWTENVSGDDGSGKQSAVVSVLRYEDSLSARAAAMEAFRGPKDTGANLPMTEDGSNDGGGGDTVRIMFSTDLAARGLDVMDVSHVINYDLPNDADTYVHRGGRAGRLGRRGMVLSLITAEQEFVLNRLGNKLGLDIRCVARQDGTKKKKKASPAEEDTKH